MLMEAKVLEDTVSRNMSNKLGCSLELIKKDALLRLVDIERKEDGTWYKIENGGWVTSRDVRVIRDIEFMFTARSLGLMDLQLFGFSLGGATSFMTDNSISRSSRSIPLPICDGGGIANSSSTIFGGKSANGGKMSDPTTGQVASAFGLKLNMGGIFGSAVNKTSLYSILSGNLDDLLGNMMDSVFNSIFSRLKFVVGFDIASLLGDSLGLFGSINGMNVDGYDGLLDPYGGGGDGGTNDTIEPYNKWASVMDEYFKYLGCNGATVTRTFDDLTWEQEASFATPYFDPKPVDSEVQFNKSLFDADYSEFEEGYEAIKDSLNLKIDRLDWFVNFNRYRITHPDYHLTNSRSYVFMTRPDLNIMDSSGSGLNPDFQRSSDAAFYYSAAEKHPNICLSLSRAFAGTHDFIPLISNTARSLDIQDESIKTSEHGETLTGWKLVYARHNIDSKTAGTFSMNYIDDNMLSIYYMHAIWVRYMSDVSRGIIDPKIDYVRNFILDYAASVYYFLTEQSGENIIFWSKYYGIFPTVAPSSPFSFNEGTIIKAPELSIQYAYAFKDDMNPLALAEFNNNSPTDFSYVPIYNEETFKCNGSIVGPPFIDTEDSGVTYKLRFRSKEN